MRLFPAVSLLAAVSAFPARALAADSRIDIHARPWAEVWVDGRKIAEETPVRGLELAPGAHQFLFTNHVSAPLEREIVVAAGGPQTLMVDMQERTLRLEPGATSGARPAQVAMVESPRLPTSGHLTVVTEPPCEIWLNGVKVGDSPVSELALDAGAHRLRLVNLARGFVAERLVTIEPGKTLRVELDLLDSTISPPELVPSPPDLVPEVPAATPAPGEWGPDTNDDWGQ
jgi:hypothetical protein